MASHPFDHSNINISFVDGHYLIMLTYVHEVIKGIKHVEHDSPLRDLVLAILGYQKNPVRIFIRPTDTLSCNVFLDTIQKLLHGFMAIYTTSALSPCAESSTIYLDFRPVRVKWSRFNKVESLECAFRLSETRNDREVFDISVHNNERDGHEYRSISYRQQLSFLLDSVIVEVILNWSD
jgi:hypothetical protein